MSLIMEAQTRLNNIDREAVKLNRAVKGKIDGQLNESDKSQLRVVSSKIAEI